MFFLKNGLIIKIILNKKINILKNLFHLKKNYN